MDSAVCHKHGQADLAVEVNTRIYLVYAQTGQPRNNWSVGFEGNISEAEGGILLTYFRHAKIRFFQIGLRLAAGWVAHAGSSIGKE